MKLKKLLRDGDDFSRLGLIIVAVLVVLMFGLAGLNQIAAVGAGVAALALLIVAFSEVPREALQFTLYCLRHRRE